MVYIMSRLKSHFKPLVFCFLFVSLICSITYASQEQVTLENKDTLVANSTESANITNINKNITPIVENDNISNKTNTQTLILSESESPGKSRKKGNLEGNEFGNSTPLEMPRPQNETVSSPNPPHLNTEISTTKPTIPKNTHNDRISTTVEKLTTLNGTTINSTVDSNVSSTVDISSSGSTTTILKNSTPSSTTTTTKTTASTTEKPRKPTLTHSIDEGLDVKLPDLKVNDIKNDSNTTKSITVPNEGSKQRTEESKAHNKATGNAEYVVPVVITIFAVPLFVSLTVYCVRQGRDYWEKRHYRRMDFLIDGMYND